jgi:hypothetical protein
VQCEQKENKRKVAEHDQGLEEENGPPDEDVNAVEVFNDFHTSSKKGLSDAARAAVVSTFLCFLEIY